MADSHNHMWNYGSKNTQQRSRNEENERGQTMNHKNGHQNNLNKGDNNIDEPITGKKLTRQKTLSMANPVLEEVLKKIKSLEKQLNSCFGKEDNTGASNTDIHHTHTKVIHSEGEEAGSSSSGCVGGNESSTHSTNDNVYATNLQVGNGNFMVFCENVESRSERQFRQIGDKNVIINVNSSCNKCQILDHSSKQIVQLDSDGEIWLEIKRRSLSDPSKQQQQQQQQQQQHKQQSCQQHPAVPQVSPQQYGFNNLSESKGYTKHARVANKPRSPVQHSCTSYDNGNNDPDPLYDKICAHPYGRLSVKIPIPTENVDSTDFAKQNLDLFLDDDSVQQYMSNGGDDFELSVCTWAYEKHEVYSEFKRPIAPEDEGMYSKPIIDEPPNMVAPPLPGRPDAKGWFHGNMDKQEAHAYLREKMNGAFIVRKATQPSANHKHTIEFMDEKTIRRLKILSSEYGFHFEYSENKTFKSLDELISAIQTVGLEIKEDSGKWKTVRVFPV